MHTLVNNEPPTGSKHQQQQQQHHHHHQQQQQQHIPQVVFNNINLVNTYHSSCNHDDTKTFDDVVFDILKVDPDDIAVFEISLPKQPASFLSLSFFHKLHFDCLILLL
jgi:hypothetical protein